MIQVAPGTKVHLAPAGQHALRLRWPVCQSGLGARAGSLLGPSVLFPSRRGDYLKILYWDGSGLCLFAKRLERGRFVWPPIVDGGLILTPAQLALLLEAIDWRRTVAPPLPARPTAV
jgi:transposase